MQINPYSIPTLISSVLLLIYGVYLYSKAKEISLAKIISLWCFAGFVWLFFYSLCYFTENATLADKFVRIGSTGVMFLATFAYHFVIVLLKKNTERKLLYLVYIINLITIFLFLFTDYFLSGTNKYFFGYYGKGTTSYLFFIVFFLSVIGRTLFILIKRLKDETLSYQERIQLKYILIGFLIASVASIDFLPKFGIEIYPFGYIFMLFWVFITTYAIIKHRLMDINIVIRKSLVYSILITIFTLIYLTIVVLTERIFQGILGYRSLVISIIFTSIIALLFIPLKNKIQSIIDRIFLGKSLGQIAHENELLHQELLRSERLRTAATLASGMAHEIKNPLTAIRTFIEYLPQKKDDKEFLDKFSKIVGSEVEKIDDLVHQLLDYSKPGPLQLKETDIHKLIDDTFELLSNQFIKYHIKVVKEYCTNSHESNTNGHELIRENSCAISANSCMIKVDPSQIKQVFLNLFLNAIEAMPQGGTLTVSTNLCSSGENKSVIICVKDTGCGIPEKDLPHVFGPFYSTKEKGSGLGLSMVYNIIKEHRGNIMVESKAGQETKFIIALQTKERLI